MCSILWMFSCHWMFCPIIFSSCFSVTYSPFTLSHLLLWRYIYILYIYICIYILPTQHQNYLQVRKNRDSYERDAERSAFFLSLSLPISTQKKKKEKWCQRNSNNRLVLLKKRFASQPEQSFVSCQDGKCIFWGSEWSLSAMTQHWRNSDSFPPLKSSSKIIKCLLYF